MLKTCPKADIRAPCPSHPFREWSALAPADHELPDVLSPYWLGSRASQYSVGDIVSVIDSKQRFFLRVQITEVHEAAVSFALLQLVVSAPADQIRPDFEKAQVVRRSGMWVVEVGGISIKKPFVTEAAAAEWIQAKQLIYHAADQDIEQGKAS